MEQHVNNVKSRVAFPTQRRGTCSACTQTAEASCTGAVLLWNSSASAVPGVSKGTSLPTLTGTTCFGVSQPQPVLRAVIT